ncbi:NUDIX hydrolase [Thioclava sp. JM3]|uniref:NUDIX domain-containing protein n=1 Tax=Thioclava sp. JM3 TaxID=1973004 RepID=UPI000B548BEF|nr:NUDIX hydrolase [Thioclava sp. JM3]OWY16518.1 NUDIX hydrolase [Thioclava sp. JM3]
MIARFGERVKSGQRYRLRPGAYAILIRDGRVLLTHQSHPVPEFQLPGGGIDPGEGPIEALHREVFEETGWAITGLRRVGAYRRFTYMPEYEFWAEKLCSIWLARPVLKRGLPPEPCHTAHWADPEEALGLLANEGERAFFRRVLRR